MAAAWVYQSWYWWRSAGVGGGELLRLGPRSGRVGPHPEVVQGSERGVTHGRLTVVVVHGLGEFGFERDNHILEVALVALERMVVLSEPQ